jgi:hypothetical protein
MIREIERYCDELEPRLNSMRYDGTKFAVLGQSDGDAILFNGLLATVWPMDQVNWPQIGVLMSQGDDGMFYRSPRRRGTNNEGYEFFFSRDMATGVIAAATDRSFPMRIWDKWLEYIDKSRPCLVKKPKWAGGGCLVRSPIYRYAPDSRSDISPSCWAMMARVARWREWPENSEMKKYWGTDGDVAVIEAQNCAAGYQLHLKAVDAYIKLLINQSREYSQKVGEIARDRVPGNLFYEFLAERRVTGSMLTKFLKIAPSVSANFGNAWIWEKASIEAELSTSCGWDFLFLGRLFQRFI